MPLPRPASSFIFGALLLLPLFPGCMDAAIEEETFGPSGGKADSLGVGGPLVLAQAGAFFEASPRHPTRIHYGYTDERAPGWQTAGTIDIVYDNFVSEEIVIDVPADAGQYLGFVIESSRSFSYTTDWSNDQFIPLAAPAGSLVTLPVSNHAYYPFAKECYTVSVQNLGPDQGTTDYSGQVTDVFYAFTPSSRSDYEADNNVPWYNLVGEPIANGNLDVMHEHDGGYKGTYVMYDEHIWVPEGLNLVFKLGIDIYGGNCYWDSDTYLREHAETQTYFREVAIP